MSAQAFSVLSSSTKLGQTKYWSISVSGNHIIRKAWIGDGKVKEFAPKVTTGKNIGRKNETTPVEQAFLEARSLWLKKQDQGYTPIDKENDRETIPTIPLPMLANKYVERGQKYLSLPFAVSRKLDGIRMVATCANQEITLTSRLGKSFSFLNKVRKQLSLIASNDLILDGELYSHTLPFGVITSAVKTKKTRSDYDDRIEYWIFDIVDVALTYKERMEKLLSIRDSYNRLVSPKDRVLQFVEYDIVSHHDQVQRYHDKYVAEGYEGVMCRNLDSLYKIKHRSNDLLKYKNFVDEEFEIVGTTEGTGSEAGAIQFTCITPNGQTFGVRPRGTMEYRQEMWTRRDEFVGKQLTVRYQGIGVKDAPRFPVGIAVRDYE